MARASAAARSAPAPRKAPAPRSKPAPRKSGGAATKRRARAHSGRAHPQHAPRRAPAKRRASRSPGRRAVPRRGRVALPRGARMLDALLTGRSWIALVGVLLAGIVFFNVDLLRMNREITQMADRAAELKRENARLRADVARLASSERIQEAAAGLGLVLPAPGDVRYLKSHPLIDAQERLEAHDRARPQLRGAGARDHAARAGGRPDGHRPHGTTDPTAVPIPPP